MSRCLAIESRQRRRSHGARESRHGRLFPDVRHAAAGRSSVHARRTTPAASRSRSSTRQPCARTSPAARTVRKARCRSLARLARPCDSATLAAYQIVGIVRDFKHMSVRENAPRFVFVPLWQPLDHPARMTLAVASDQPTPTAGAGGDPRSSRDSRQHARSRTSSAYRIRSTQRSSASGCCRSSQRPLRHSRSDSPRLDSTACSASRSRGGEPSSGSG